MPDYNAYLADQVTRFWSYRNARFANEQAIFDEPCSRGVRPPVFLQGHELKNVIIDPQLADSEARLVLSMLPTHERHRWFRSMKSSQALVQSVFGNLRAMKLCSVLQDVRTEEGFHPFEDITPIGASLSLERTVNNLGEPRLTSVDVSVQGRVNVAIECKLAECDVGHCSRPNLNEKHPEHCDGSYRYQHSRRERCVLTTIGIKYWEYVPPLFTWRTDKDYAACPLRSTYQLVRNVLAASIGASRELVPGVAILLFDERNPEFHKNGAAGIAFATVKHALREPERLQRLSWQTVIQTLSVTPRLQWLRSELADKYGL